MAPDGSKFNRIPGRVDIIIATDSSKVVRLKFSIVRKLASMNFCSLVTQVIVY